MAALTEGKYAGEFIVSEANGTRSRETVTIASGQNVVAGEVLGKITASGKYAAFNQDAVDGTEAAAGIAYGNTDASAGDAKGVIIARDAEVADAEITWPSDLTAGEQTTAETQLAALGILVR